MKRKKAAVVFNDIQGYTSLMQENETYAVEIRQRHKEVVDRLTQAYKGTIIQYYGDGTLSIFENSLDAVQCALSMQKEFHQSPQIPLRIGINSGEILMGPDGVYGDSVNIASRIERMSVPGSVLISEKVFDEIKLHGGILTRDLGQFELKNVRHPVSIHAVIAEDVTIPDPAELAGKIGYKEKSILVLPFNNLSKNPQHDSFSDEITDQIISALSQVEGIRVTSRTSSFSFKDKHVNLRQLHQELDIDYVLEGSVRMHGQKVRITAQLIHAANDFHLWSETYHREVEDVFQVQDEIASMISNKLKASFQTSALPQADDPDSDHELQSDAFTQYHKGRFHWKQMQPGYMDLAIQYFRKALETDSNFFPAWPALATAYAYKGYYNQMMPAEATRLSLTCLEEVNRLNPEHLRSHVAWAFHHLFYSWDWEKVVIHLRKAMSLQDNDSFIFPNTIFHAAGMYQLISGQHDKALQTYKKALKMDPLNVSIRMEMSRVYLYRREFAKALDLNDSIIRNRPDYSQAHDSRGWILFSMGQQREGIESFEQSRKLSTLPITGLAGLAYAYARTSQPQMASATRELMQSLSQDIPTYAPYYDLAIAHLGAQEYKPMFEQLHFAYEARMPVLIFLEANPIWDEIRRFTEYQQVVQGITGDLQRPPL